MPKRTRPGPKTPLPDLSDTNDRVEAAGTQERVRWPMRKRQELYAGPWNIGFQFRDLHRIFRGRVQDTLRQHGSSVSHWGYLWALYEEDGLAQNELARRVRLMGPSVVVALNQMERLDLVRRQRSEADRRVVHVFLTEKGRSMRKDMMHIAIAGNEAALRHLTNEEVEQLLSLLAKVRTGLEESQDEPAASR
ncbi:MarR family winged helix-turn-helix transcriptional regulator [Roseomonas sp. KE2513]|uniref:MarR family winged helix-turn-helix transcriptional regulator n=1 Tax=Roseomonas sp. KE2513 TaxID=2479202 RepID=UPI0018E058CA|nr:MarR family winged helix-turn-helix transcriptional regulator [Roseomonas sp. KE2513]